MRLFTNQSGEALPEYVVLAASLAILTIPPLNLLGEYVDDTLRASMACEMLQLGSGGSAGGTDPNEPTVPKFELICVEQEIIGAEGDVNGAAGGAAGGWANTNPS